MEDGLFKNIILSFVISLMFSSDSFAIEDPSPGMPSSDDGLVYSLPLILDPDSSTIAAKQKNINNMYYYIVLKNDFLNCYKGYLIKQNAVLKMKIESKYPFKDCKDEGLFERAKNPENNNDPRSRYRNRNY